MNLRPVLHTISYMLFVSTLGMLLSALVGWIEDDSRMALVGMSQAAGITFILGSILWVTTRGPVKLKRRDGYAIVTFSWLAVALFGALPYMLTGAISDFPGALFESMSGFTTTGASVIDNLGEQSHSILFWRSLSQWLGGMGVLVLVIAILPFLGVGAQVLYRAEMPGPTKNKLAPHTKSTAKILWVIYLVLTVACFFALMLCGMGWFDSICHAFTTLATGGFSTHPESVGGFNSIAVECVIVVFMIAGGINFALHFRALNRERGVYFRDSELRFMVLLLVSCILLMAGSLYFQDGPVKGLFTSLRVAVFECISILTTTGFGGHGTQSFGEWSVAAVTLVGILGLLGACAGSTSGGVKLVRIMLAVKFGIRELRLMVQPSAVYKVRLQGKVIDEKVLSRTIGFLLLFVVLAAVSAQIMTYFAPDEITAVSSAVACLTNVGPGVGEHIGPAGSFKIIDPAGKIYLSFLMLMGRLELFTFMVLFLRVFWKK